VARKRSDHLEKLRRVPLFAGCSDRELKSIAASVKEVHFPAGKTICKEGDSGVGLHVILDGDTKVQINGRTRRRLGPGAFFGEIALLDGGPRSATVIAETDVTTLWLAVWSFRSVLSANPSLAVKMLEELGRRVRSTDRSINQ
jgi:CRP/FNR family transcriptional regulator, cyclic AMP receptor protein